MLPARQGARERRYPSGRPPKHQHNNICCFGAALNMLEDCSPASGHGEHGRAVPQETPLDVLQFRVAVSAQAPGPKS